MVAQSLPAGIPAVPHHEQVAAAQDKMAQAQEKERLRQAAAAATGGLPQHVLPEHLQAPKPLRYVASFNTIAHDGGRALKLAMISLEDPHNPSIPPTTAVLVTQSSEGKLSISLRTTPPGFKPRVTEENMRQSEDETANFQLIACDDELELRMCGVNLNVHNTRGNADLAVLVVHHKKSGELSQATAPIAV